MTVTEIRQILESPYDRSIWKNFLQTQFTNNKLNAEDRKISLSDNPISKECLSLGFYEIDDYTKIGIFEIELSPKVNLARNRVQLRNLLKDITKQMAGAMVVFVQGEQWRFSYISKRKFHNKDTNTIEDKETAPKRYTYLFGKGEKALTAAQNFDKLIQKQKGNLYDLLSLDDFEDAFSVDKLGKEFFKNYKEIYEDFVEYITGYRYVKKGSKWTKTQVHEPHFDFHDIFKGDSKAVRDFFKRMMGRIVFLYFIQKKGWMAVPKNENWDKGNPDYLYQLFKNAQYKELFYSDYLVPLFFDTLNNPDSENEKNDLRFPYLNGGLFDKSQDFLYDKLALPSAIFDKLFDTFNRYNFTIYEDAPDEHTVAVDPEMLGHIFENLLEDNKDKGAFYTPKEIVHYMCKESLKAYLLAKEDLDATENSIAQSALENIILQQELSKDELKYADKYAYKIIDALDHVKICDPAIGSGAFPMGLLQEIFNAQVYLQELKGFTKAKSDAEIKKHIIEESIYGVDIDEGAVDIARLRFWLSLVVDEPKPQPLPNLSFKIVCANTLIPLGKPKGDLGLTNEIADQIEAIREEYFTANKDAKKHLEMQFRNLQNKLWTTAKEWATAADVEIYKKISEFNPFADKSCSWFDSWWMFGVKDGFDIVIGNPPYVQLQKDGGKLAKIYQAFNYKTFQRTGDIYSLFYEKGIDVLKKNGVLTFITSNSWMRTEYGEKTRHLFINNNPLLVITFEGNQVFDNAIVDSNILIIQKNINKNNTKGAKIKEIQNTLQEVVESNKVILSHLSNSEWFIGSQNEIFIKETVEEVGKPLGKWDVNINRGITTGFNEAFFIDDKIKRNIINNDPLSKDLIKKLLRGRMLSKFYTSFDNSHIIFTKRGIEIDNFKGIKEHLFNYYDNLKPKNKKEDKNGRKPGTYQWYEIQDNTNYYPEFSKPKIFWIQLSDRNRFTYTEEEVFATNSCFMMTSNSDNISLKYLLSVLNSKMVLYYYKMIGSSSGMGTLEWTGVGTQKIPIPEIVQKLIISAFENISDFVIYLLKNKENSILSHTDNARIASHLEDILNMMVYELYFEEHMKEVNLDVLQFVTPVIENLQKLPIEQQIKELYEWYQKPENAVRQRMMLIDTRSPDILAVIHKSV